MSLIWKLLHRLRALARGPALNRARVRNLEAAERLDAALREVLKK